MRAPVYACVRVRDARVCVCACVCVGCVSDSVYLAVARMYDVEWSVFSGAYVQTRAFVCCVPIAIYDLMQTNHHSLPPSISCRVDASGSIGEVERQLFEIPLFSVFMSSKH